MSGGERRVLAALSNIVASARLHNPKARALVADIAEKAGTSEKFATSWLRDLEQKGFPIKELVIRNVLPNTSLVGFPKGGYSLLGSDASRALAVISQLYIETNQPVQLSKVAERLGVDRGKVSCLVPILIDKGFPIEGLTDFKRLTTIRLDAATKKMTKVGPIELKILSALPKGEPYAGSLEELARTNDIKRPALLAALKRLKKKGFPILIPLEPVKLTVGVVETKRDVTLGPAERKVLELLMSHPPSSAPITYRKIGNMSGLSKSTISTVIKTLEKKGFRLRQNILFRGQHVALGDVNRKEMVGVSLRESAILQFLQSNAGQKFTTKEIATKLKIRLWQTYSSLASLRNKGLLPEGAILRARVGRKPERF
ncbi:MarR family transcriptional regulator [archaeon]|nr:MarR family transcriptional regulator [archaeon]